MVRHVLGRIGPPISIEYWHCTSDLKPDCGSLAGEQLAHGAEGFCVLVFNILTSVAEFSGIQACSSRLQWRTEPLAHLIPVMMQSCCRGEIQQVTISSYMTNGVDFVCLSVEDEDAICGRKEVGG